MRQTNLRTQETHDLYVNAIKDLNFIEKAKPLKEWAHWKKIAVQYPYDNVAEKHYLLAPKRKFVSLNEITFTELTELLKILNSLQSQYDQISMNFPNAQSIPTHLHFHLLTLKEVVKDELDFDLPVIEGGAKGVRKAPNVCISCEG